MKKLIYIPVILWICFNNAVIAQQNTFSKVIYDSLGKGIQASSAIPSFDNGHLIAGDMDYGDGIVIKVDSNGNVIWNKVINNVNAISFPSIQFRNIISTNDSCYILSGSAYNSVANRQDALCVKINSNGDMLWSQTITYSSGIELLSGYQTLDSGYVLTGYLPWRTETPYERMFVTKLNYNGNLEWSRTFSSGENRFIGIMVEQIQDSSYIVTGYLGERPVWKDNAFLLRLSQTGTPLWAKKYYPLNDYGCAGHDFVITKNGILLYINMGDNITIMETDFSGNILWSKSYRNFSYYIYYDQAQKKLHKTSDNGYIMVSGDEFSEGKMIKVDSVGDLIWSLSLVLNPFDVIETNSKEYFIIGNGPLVAASLKSSINNIGIIQIDSIGTTQDCIYPEIVSATDVTMNCDSVNFSYTEDGSESDIPVSTYSEEILTKEGCIYLTGGAIKTITDKDILIYPNPGTGIFTVTLFEANEGELIVFNNLGQAIFQLEFHNNEFDVDLSRQTKGIYFYKLITSHNNIATGKLIFTE